ncbi:hypothetical protein IEI94_08265 [Halomonas sp. ML-15]|uniref:hypothetical protein n=1 Tax=Halomonas sp. ML-15 TaxID=2773305 RepID=UPI001747439F|nr:hypothetical protein [Halomonas sp. ML-15]MBD3895840.1 hypothetical protein [Halomonas sp. ML-15]
MNTRDPSAPEHPAALQLDAALQRLAQARLSEPLAAKDEVLASARAVMALDGGLDALYARVSAIESAGVFANSDWEQPVILQPALAMRSLRQGDASLTVIEVLSEIRLLAVAKGDVFHPGISAEQAQRFLNQVMALNLDLLSATLSEADRQRPQALGEIVHALYRYLLESLGYENIHESLVGEVSRLLSQRPVQTESIKQMIGQIAECLFDPEADTAGMDEAARLVSALFGPAPGCRDDPGLTVYRQRLKAMDEAALGDEAAAFASAMHDTGLVSPYHPLLLRYLRGYREELIPCALGLSMTGHDVLQCYSQLVDTLIDEAVYPETCQSLYGLAMLLERGTLFTPAVASGLWRQIGLTLCTESSQKLATVFGDAHPPRVFLLAGVIGLLGQPLGVGQGNNPTCQSVIGLSMWAYNDPDYLLQLVVWAARDDEITMRFEGQRVSSRDLEAGLAKEPPVDVDAVSLILVAHLDRIYIEMGRLCGQRDDDLHRWINPELYGWWVGEGFRVVVGIHSQKLDDYDDFIRHFYACYHPFYNGNLPVVHPQPAGIAVTDSGARLVGRHAITILRVALDTGHQMRVYFFNPNNDSGQNWGQGITCTTHGYGERPGEASLPIAEFASRLYVFHYDPLEVGNRQAVPASEVARIAALGETSWAKGL